MICQRPTCEVNGIGAAYQGRKASKTVLPSKATPRFPRAVGEQDPLVIRENFRKMSKTCCRRLHNRVDKAHGAGRASARPTDDPAIRQGRLKSAFDENGRSRA